ncbi:hypothetical protein QVD17_16747 [Tagetes erecta]|uniref:Uncharacterized protein n=1 Tax=Tagetes erecta TaxID=13708 RepID=A0AAD8NZT6_TARER|nr:hypothetical protein QVD17_16747 [Tagetes erecta]
MVSQVQSQPRVIVVMGKVEGQVVFLLAVVGQVQIQHRVVVDFIPLLSNSSITNMSYEEILALKECIRDVNTGLTETPTNTNEKGCGRQLLSTKIATVKRTPMLPAMKHMQEATIQVCI